MVDDARYGNTDTQNPGARDRCITYQRSDLTSERSDVSRWLPFNRDLKTPALHTPAAKIGNLEPLLIGSDTHPHDKATIGWQVQSIRRSSASGYLGSGSVFREQPRLEQLSGDS